MRSTLPAVASALALAVTSPGSALALVNGDAIRGQAQYEGRCGGCHSLDANRVGPAHRGVVGRAPGTAPGYAYSAAVRKLGGVWTPDRLDMWLKGPQAFAPGAKMFLSVSDPQVRADIIAYLVSTSRPQAKAPQRGERPISPGSV